MATNFLSFIFMKKFLILILFLFCLPQVTLAYKYIYETTEGEIILDGKNLGYGENPVVDGQDYAYEKMKEDGVHIIYNGKDIGKGHSPQLSEGNILYETERNFKNTVVFNGEKFYEDAFDPELKDGNFIFFKKIRKPGLKENLQGNIFVFYNGKYYCDGDNDDLKLKTDSYDKEYREILDFSGNNIICEQKINDGGTDKSFIVLNGIVIDEGYKGRVSDTHYAYFKKIKYGHSDTETEVIIVDGKNLGEGEDFMFSEESFVFFKKNPENNYDIIFNGTNLGEIDKKENFVFEDGSVSFTKKKDVKEYDISTGNIKTTEKEFVYFNGINKGIGNINWNKGSENKKIYVSKNHIAFERKRKKSVYESQEDDEDLELDADAREIASKTEVETSFVVFDGKEKTEIIEGTLRMDEGYFAFAKNVTVKKEDEDYTRERYLYYRENDFGDNPSRDDEYAKRIKYIYTDIPYIYSGAPNGSIKRLGEGEPYSIRVKDGKVAYVKKEKVIVSYYDDGEKKKRAELKNYVMINGTRKGEGNIATLMMDEGQYAFANTEKGRYFLTINGEKQSYPGFEVYFFEQTNKDSDNSSLNVIRPFYGKIYNRANKTYLKTKDGFFRLVATDNVNFKKYNLKEVRISAQKKRYKIKGTDETLYAYKTFSIKEKNPQEKIVRGTLLREGKTFYLLMDNKKYPLRYKSSNEEEKLQGLTDNVVNLEIKNNNHLWEILTIIK
jgi:hypothetical protein